MASFMVACRKFFGQKTGQNLQDFGAEIRALTEKDKTDLAPELEKALNEKIDR